MINRKRITSICDNCNICGLPVITCICNSIKKVKTKSKFIILSSEREIYRNTNTASLLKLINPEEDSLRFYYLGNNWNKKIEHIGAEKTYDPEGVIII